MSTISFRLLGSLHKVARNLSREENISINQLITLALAKVPHGEPEENDHLPKGRHRSSVKKSYSVGPRKHSKLPRSHFIE